MEYDFSNISMQEIIKILKRNQKDNIEFKVLNPDLGSGLYAGEKTLISGKTYTQHSLRAWCTLAELLGYRILLPKVLSDQEVLIRYEKLHTSKSFHDENPDDYREKYGSNSAFARINKLEEPSFIWHYMAALNAVQVSDKSAILNLGIGRGDEFVAIRNMLPADIFAKIDIAGVDHSKSAISSAIEMLSDDNIRFLCRDINDLQSLSLGKFDLIISIGTLQSPNINSKTLIMSLVQKYFTQDGAMILGFPNARWIDGELIYGAKAPNYPYPEMSLVIKDIYWIKKYLQQHKFRVTITGREYLFLTATKIGIHS
ncbi:MAG: methyltransferase domain-containing protein [Sulfurovum sp.]|nr:methyltransferase domain-containing protein [Sulfurovum sp.]